MNSSKKDQRRIKKDKYISLNGRKDPINLLHRYNTYIDKTHIKNR